LRKYWHEIGFYGSTGQHLYDFLSKQVGDPENKPFWLPALSRNGTPFMDLQGDRFDVGHGRYYQIPFEGFYLDYMTFIAIPVREWKNNPWERAYFGQLLNDNRGSGHSLINYKAIAMFGLQIDKRTLRPVFVLGHKDSLTGYEDLIDAEQLGGSKQVFRPDFDPKLMSAYYELYLRGYREVTQSMADGSYRTGIMAVYSGHWNNPDVLQTPFDTEIIFQPRD
jgi:hypothetical protein